MSSKKTARKRKRPRKAVAKQLPGKAATKARSASSSSQEVKPKVDRSFAKRWAPELKDDGFTQVSTFFLENYHHLKPYDLTHGEAMFVIHLMQYKWSEDAPFPAYKTIAQRMRVSTKTARRFAQSLDTKGYLKREIRKGYTNRFHLKPLMNALVALKQSQKPNKGRRKTHSRED